MSKNFINSSRALLCDTILASAQNVQAVLAGRSLSDSLAATPVALRASAQAVSFHVMRRLGTARAIRKIMVRRTPPNPLFDALLLVALVLLDTAMEHDAAADPAMPGAARPSVPLYGAHTVVDQAVKAVNAQYKLRPYKGFLNATLRGYTRERASILAQALQDPVAVWNHPQWWVAQLQRAYPERWQDLLHAANQPGPMTLRVNRRRASVDQVLDALAQADIAAYSPEHEAITLVNPQPVQGVPGFDEGWWSVQDVSAQRAGALLPIGPGLRVLDACAAPGGKTAHLLERADIDLLALDSDADRLKRVDANLQRLGLAGPNVQLECADASDPDAWWDGRPFDAILADVPCTASGVVRRHPDIRWLRRESDIARTAALQRDIIDALWTTLKPGGHMLYATCSIFPQEGEQQAAEFQARQPDARRLPAPGQVLPLAKAGRDACDGFFYALFSKAL